LVTGPTGVGKTFWACALGQQAYRHGHRVIYRRIPRLFPELTLAHDDGTYPAVLGVSRASTSSFWMIGASSDPKTRSARISWRSSTIATARSTVITCQLPTDRWHEHLGDPTLADAIL